MRADTIKIKKQLERVEKLLQQAHLSSLVVPKDKYIQTARGQLISIIEIVDWEGMNGE